jgi:cytochrome c553
MKKILPGVLVALTLSIASLPSQAQDTQGSAAAGEKKNAMCIGCHGISGYHTGFPEVYHVPKLSGQSAGYIASALREYRSGERKHPSMRTMASSLSPQEIADLAAYYESTGLSSPSAPKAIDTAKGQALVEKGGCQGCHGPNLSKPIAPDYPVIAGQHADYLYAALRAYKTENKVQIGRSHPIMSAIAKQFSDDELKDLSKYVESLPSTLQTIQPSRFR